MGRGWYQRLRIRQTHAAIDARREERRRTSEERRYSYSTSSHIPNAFDYPRPPRPLNTYSLRRCTRGTQTAQLMFTCGIDRHVWCGRHFLSQGAPVSPFRQFRHRCCLVLPTAAFFSVARCTRSLFRQLRHRCFFVLPTAAFFFPPVSPPCSRHPC